MSNILVLQIDEVRWSGRTDVMFRCDRPMDIISTIVMNHMMQGFYSRTRRVSVFSSGANFFSGDSTIIHKLETDNIDANG